MLQTIDIPNPTKADTETVATALETAALFGAKGDGREAVHWLRRAAESAGEAGDDARALSLSRLAADLHDELTDAESSAAPAPPSSSNRAADDAQRAASLPPELDGALQQESPRLSYPPPPSARGARPSGVPRPSQLPRPSSRPTFSGSRPPRAQPSQPVAAERAAAPVSVKEQTATTAEVATTAEPSPVEAAPVSSPRLTTASTGARAAARVAVTISTTKVGCLEVRLLKEGEAPRLGASEALLVMLDPASTLLAR